MIDSVKSAAERDNSEEVIDWAGLIGRVVDEDIAREVVPLCVEDNRERIEALAAAVQAGNAEDVKSCAHAIKGSAGNVGAVPLSQVARRLEETAARDDLSEAEELCRQIETEFARFESFVSKPDWIETARKLQTSSQA